MCRGCGLSVVGSVHAGDREFQVGLPCVGKRGGCENNNNKCLYCWADIKRYLCVQNNI